MMPTAPHISFPASPTPPIDPPSTLAGRVLPAAGAAAHLRVLRGRIAEGTGDGLHSGVFSSREGGIGRCSWGRRRQGGADDF